METSCPICGNWTHEGWQKAGERLPEEGVTVIAITPEGTRCFDRISDGDWECKIFDCLEQSGEKMNKNQIYTHWIKVPEYPQE